MSEKASILSDTVLPIHYRKDKAAKSRKRVAHVYCKGQSENYAITKCKEYCDYYKGLVLGGIGCSYHGAVTCHLELKVSDPATGKLRLTEVFK